MNRFGPLPMLNLIIALREKSLPIEALNQNCFYLQEWKWIQAGYAASMLELVEAARKLEGK